MKYDPLYTVVLPLSCWERAIQLIAPTSPKLARKIHNARVPTWDR